ncbi:WecB/TagA/CpsF family glycosyltransferase [Enterococcus faecium]
MKKRYQIFDTFVDCLSIQETISKIENRIDQGLTTYQVSINADKINQMQNNYELKNIIDNADIINADGISIVLSGKLLGVPISERVSGIDIFTQLLTRSEDKGYSVFFLGATEESLLTMLEKIEKNYPKLIISGYRNGYFDSIEEKQIVADIYASHTDILFLGFSSPQKEIWIKKNQKESGARFIMGVGGSFDIYSGKTKRAPELIQNLGFEWLYRFIQEPTRLYNRYIIGNFKFMRLLLQEKISCKILK